ncbi:MAG: EAL domain-containing protein, partial [Alphaproteobacteria bacterium]|nr:EAL domain-containing protein [Alphaproteobacteria bacterium]
RGRVEIGATGATGSVVLTRLGPGEIFGEMALVDGAPRSASARCLDDCVFVVVGRDQIHREIAGATPLMSILLRTLIHRLRVATSRVLSPALPIGAEETARIVARIEGEHELRHALENGEVVAFLQPIVALDGAAPAGFEALARWAHPTRGLLPPAALLGPAAEADLLETLDFAVAGAAARKVAGLNRDLTAAGRAPAFLSANFSAPHFADTQLAGRLAPMLEEAGLDPIHLKVEITETTLIVNPHAAEALARVKALGASVSLDDFGTGYSGLSYLSRFPIDHIKIDQSFTIRLVADRRIAEIVRSAVDLARLLDISAVAEGIETPTQAQLLAEMGVSFGQGYLFGAPVPADAACAAFLAA